MPADTTPKPKPAKLGAATIDTLGLAEVVAIRLEAAEKAGHGSSLQRVPA